MKKFKNALLHTVTGEAEPNELTIAFVFISVLAAIGLAVLTHFQVIYFDRY